MRYFAYTNLNFFSMFFALFGLGFFVSYFLYRLSRYVSSRVYDSTKVTIYECGFDPFGDAREPFDVSFYLVALLFILFDLEVIFFVPWAVSICGSGGFGCAVIAIFLFVLGVGFLYEWLRGALDWS